MDNIECNAKSNADTSSTDSGEEASASESFLNDKTTPHPTIDECTGGNASTSAVQSNVVPRTQDGERIPISEKSDHLNTSSPYFPVHVTGKEVSCSESSSSNARGMQTHISAYETDVRSIHSNSKDVKEETENTNDTSDSHYQRENGRLPQHLESSDGNLFPSNRMKSEDSFLADILITQKSTSRIVAHTEELKGQEITTTNNADIMSKSFSSSIRGDDCEGVEPTFLRRSQNISSVGPGVLAIPGPNAASSTDTLDNIDNNTAESPENSPGRSHPFLIEAQLVTNGSISDSDRNRIEEEARRKFEKQAVAAEAVVLLSKRRCKLRTVMWFFVVVLAIGIAVIMGIFIGSKDASSGKLENSADLPESLAPPSTPPIVPSSPPTVPSIPSAVPSTLPPTMTPTETLNYFISTEQLYRAVDAYLQNTSEFSGVALQYGHPIGTWDVSRVTNFTRVFDPLRNEQFDPDRESNDTVFIDDVSGWDVSNGRVFFGMFAGARNFTADLSSWQMGKATDLSYMFFDATLFNSSISEWNTSNVQDMTGMFQWATWDVSNVHTFDRMFRGAVSFTGNISSWNTSNAKSLAGMFARASSFSSDVSRWDVGKVTNMVQTFSYAEKFNSDISMWQVNKVTSMMGMFAGASSFQTEISKWNVSQVEDMSYMFQEAISFEGNLSTWDTSSCTDMSFMFDAATGFQGDLSNWNVAKVTTMEQMFAFATNFSSDLSRWDTSNVRSTRAMFAETNFDFDISSWNMTQVENCSYMFYYATSFTGGDLPWNVDNVKDMTSMFHGAESFSGGVSGWRTHNVHSMSYMFSGADIFVDDLSQWDVAAVTSMESMFAGCSLFNSDISSWNVSGVTTTASMFYLATSFRQNLCPWGELFPEFPELFNMFLFSGCPVDAEPDDENPTSGPYCFSC